MAIFKLNDLGGFEELESLCVRSTAPGREFARVKSLEGREGRVQWDVVLNRQYEACFDMTVEEALRVAVQLVDAAEHAEVQRQEIQRRAEEQQAALAKRWKPRKRS